MRVRPCIVSARRLSNAAMRASNRRERSGQEHFTNEMSFICASEDKAGEAATSRLATEQS